MHKAVATFNEKQKKRATDFRSGDVVRVHRTITEGGKTRTQIFEGMIIAIKGGQSSSPMLTVRKVTNSIGVEIIVPLYSPSIPKVELVKRAKVRRSKLYYVRDKAAKALRFKFTDGKDVTGVFEEEVQEEVPAAEEVPTEEKEEAPTEEATPENAEKKEESASEKA